MRRRLLIALPLLFLFKPMVFSQVKITEAELNQKLTGVMEDTARVRLILNYCAYNKSNSDSNLKYAMIALSLAEKEKPGPLLVRAFEAAGDGYWFKRNYPKASEYYFKELELAENLNLIRFKGRAYYNIGWMKCIQRNSFKDRNYLIHALRIFESIKDTSSILEVYNGLAGVYNSEAGPGNNYLDSANFYFRNLVFFTEKTSPRNNVVIHSNYANFLMHMGKYEESKKYLFRCIEEAKKSDDTSNYASSMKNLGSVYLLSDSLPKAKKIYLEVIPLLHRTAQLEALIDVYGGLTHILSNEGKFREALEFHKKHAQMRDSLIKNVFRSNLVEKEAQYEIEKRESNIRKLEHQNEVSELKNKQSRYVIFGLLIIAALVAFFTVNLFKSNKAKQLANRMLNEKNQLIEEQKKAVEERNTDITNSINYAKRIQEAILPAKEVKYKLFPDAFVLFRPKDIVSGDFYWFTEKNGNRLIAAIDCTGHGVPGAFMSMIGNTFLQETVNEKGITRPSLILNELRNHVISSLKQTDVIDSTKDGMDMALLSFNSAMNRVEFAGANNPLWLIRKGECTEYKGDKRPIGYYRGLGLEFTNHEIALNKGDALYIFTDGYADQFGGAGLADGEFGQGKKFKYKQLRDLLISIQHLSMAEQEKVLLQEFNNWKGNLEQVDDVCVIGVRV